jgi:hypothetical protein
MVRHRRALVIFTAWVGIGALMAWLDYRQQPPPVAPPPLGDPRSN